MSNDGAKTTHRHQDGTVYSGPDCMPGETRVSLASCGHPANDDGECGCAYWPEKAPIGQAIARDGWHSQYADEHGNTLDVTGDPRGVSLAVCAGGVTEDVEVAAHKIPELLATLLFGPERESMGDLAGRYMAMFTPPREPCPKCDGSGRVEYDETAPATGPCDECGDDHLSGTFPPIDPQYVVLWLVTAYLARLDFHADYETWPEQDREDHDGLLRDLISTAYALRPKLVPGVPDHPAEQFVHADGDKLAAARRASQEIIRTDLALPWNVIIYEWYEMQKHLRFVLARLDAVSTRYVTEATSKGTTS